ncbi:MAG: phosphodiester glycosidase family protein [bacterium]
MIKNRIFCFLFIYIIFYISKIIAADLKIYKSYYDNEFIILEIYDTNINQIIENLDITYNSFKEITLTLENLKPNKIENSLENVKILNKDNLTANLTKIKITLNYPIPYKLIKKELYNNTLIIKIPLYFKLINKIDFYDKSTNKIFAYLYNNYIVTNYNNKTNALNIIIFNFLVPYKVDFVSLNTKDNLVYKYDNFYIAINGTYFAKKDSNYFTVAGVVDDNNIISFPVEYRPTRGYFSILVPKDNRDLRITIFDYLTNIKEEFIKLINTTKKLYDIDILVQAGPLIYKDYSYIMDVDKEAFGLNGNNIINPAARTLITNITDNNSLDNLVIFCILPYNYERNKGLNLYDIPYFLDDIILDRIIMGNKIKDVLNLDGGSSVNFYINSNLINSVYSNKTNPYKSQNYLIFKTNIKDYYYKNNLTYYYYIPGIVDFFYKEEEIIKKKGKYFINFNDGINSFSKLIDNQ